MVRLLLLGLLALACERRAPGPAECRKLALTVFGVESREALAPRQRDQLDNVTRECLVRPYDRELVRCMEETRRFQVCQMDFVRRRALR